MKKLILLFLVISISLSQKNDPAGDLANAERSFSYASETIGIKESFLQFLSDDCVMFNPHPVNGKDLYRSRPANPAHLSWYPTFVEVSASGDFGLSTGPWEYRTTKIDTPVAYGHYFSIWKKQPEGRWKVILDHGISYPKGGRRTEEEHVKMLVHLSENHGEGESTRTELLEAEHAFILALKNNESIKSYSRFGAENIRVYRVGSFPSINKYKSLEYIKNHPRQTGFSPIATQVSSSGDLGFIYGLSVDANNDTSSYVRVWRKEIDWKIAIDILEPFKKQ